MGIWRMKTPMMSYAHVICFPTSSRREASLPKSDITSASRPQNCTLSSRMQCLDSMVLPAPIGPRTYDRNLAENKNRRFQTLATAPSTPPSRFLALSRWACPVEMGGWGTSWFGHITFPIKLFSSSSLNQHCDLASAL
jgi:hypothetical protein